MPAFPSGFRPMLACRDAIDIEKLTYPLLASPKIDGIRAVSNAANSGDSGPRLFSRTLKAIPNLYIQQMARNELFPTWMDGELVTFTDGNMDDFTTTQSKVMSSGGKPEFKWMMFDEFSNYRNPFVTREAAVIATAGFDQAVGIRSHFSAIVQEPIYNAEQLAAYEDKQVNLGYEGVMLRDPQGRYKFGRSTLKEGILLKMKRWEDDEATIVGFVEEMANENEDVKDAFGNTKRSTNAEGKRGKGTLGAFVCSWRGVEFELGSGFTSMQRKVWGMETAQPLLMGAKVTFKFFGIGTLGRPRFPVFKALRDEVDLPA